LVDLLLVPEAKSLFSTRQYALLVKPPFAPIKLSQYETLPQNVNEGFEFLKNIGVNDSIVVGAISFDADQMPQLFVSRNYKLDWRHNRDHIYVSKKEPLTPEHIKEVPTKSAFKEGVQQALYKFEKKEIEKVVLSRTLEIEFDKKVQVKKILETLESVNKSGFVFGVKVLNEKSINAKYDKTLVGASPELLLSKRGNKISAMPLAGSEPRGNTQEQEALLSGRLLKSEKDLREHALVVDSIKQVLTPFCKTLDVPSKPSLINTPTMWHLATSIEGELKDNQFSSLDIALAMHPTPAVCGFPKEKARTAISEIESHERGLFTGMVGWSDSNGDGDWVVTIRCATVSESNATLYAGAGIVAGSCAQKEYEETGAKFNTMLNAFGLKGDI